MDSVCSKGHACTAGMSPSPARDLPGTGALFGKAWRVCLPDGGPVRCFQLHKRDAGSRERGCAGCVCVCVCEGTGVGVRVTQF